MARNPQLDAMLREYLGGRANVTEKAMFGGNAFLLNGNMLFAAGSSGLLVRLGKGNDDWAIALPGVDRMVMNGRPMPGWVRAQPPTLDDAASRGHLLDAGLQFVEHLPAK